MYLFSFYFFSFFDNRYERHCEHLFLFYFFSFFDNKQVWETLRATMQKCAVKIESQLHYEPIL